MKPRAAPAPPPSWSTDARGHRTTMAAPPNGGARDVDPVTLAGLDAHGQRHRAVGVSLRWARASAPGHSMKPGVTLPLQNAHSHPVFGGASRGETPGAEDPYFHRRLPKVVRRRPSAPIMRPWLTRAEGSSMSDFRHVRSPRPGGERRGVRLDRRCAREGGRVYDAAHCIPDCCCGPGRSGPLTCPCSVAEENR